jgi:hypothetical protein
MAMGSGSVCSSTGRRCLGPLHLLLPLRPRLGSENGVDGGRLCTIIILLLRLLTPQAAHHNRDDSATAAISSPGGSLP